MIYNQTQYIVDKERGVCRIMGICFEMSASDEKITSVFAEISHKQFRAPALMTRKALCLYLKAPSHIIERMSSMPIGTSFIYDGFQITRWSHSTYNGKAI